MGSTMTAAVAEAATAGGVDPRKSEWTQQNAEATSLADRLLRQESERPDESHLFFELMIRATQEPKHVEYLLDQLARDRLVIFIDQLDPLDQVKYQLI